MLDKAVRDVPKLAPESDVGNMAAARVPPFEPIAP